MIAIGPAQVFFPLCFIITGKRATGTSYDEDEQSNERGMRRFVVQGRGVKV